jgi:hypothetical protein
MLRRDQHLVLRRPQRYRGCASPSLPVTGLAALRRSASFLEVFSQDAAVPAADRFEKNTQRPGTLDIQGAVFWRLVGPPASQWWMWWP